MKLEINIPEYYDKRTKVYIKTICQLLSEDEDVKKLDQLAMEMLAYAHHNWVMAKDVLKEEGMFVVNAKGVKTKSHPAVKIAHDYEVKLYKLMKEFRLTPKSREKLLNIKEDTPFDTFLKGTIESR